MYNRRFAWREEATRLHTSESYSDGGAQPLHADALAMQLLRAPAEFDVIVTDNLFGDILSDEASMPDRPASGLLPSASLGAPDATGRRKALYEPIHGSAPDIAGKGLANPIAQTLSYAMMLRYSFDLGKDADMVELVVVENVLKAGLSHPATRWSCKARRRGRRSAPRKWATRSSRNSTGWPRSRAPTEPWTMRWSKAHQVIPDCWASRQQTGEQEGRSTPAGRHR